MMSKQVAGADRAHPDPDRLLAFVEKMAGQIGVAYVRRSAEFIQREYPASAPAMLPKLRAIYRQYSHRK